MRDVLRGIGIVVFVGAILWLNAMAGASTARGENLERFILIDGEKASGSVKITEGVHKIEYNDIDNAADEMILLAVYDNQRMNGIAINSDLEYNFPEDAENMEIALFRLDDEFRPVSAAVRVKVNAAAGQSQSLIYRGEATCYDAFNEYDDREFDDYNIKLSVITRDDKIIAIQDVMGYDLSGKETNAVNKSYLSIAADGTSKITGMIEKIINKNSVDDIDAVTGATCASNAIVRAVQNALEQTPEVYDDPGGGDDNNKIPDGIYAGQTQCLTGYINYMVNLDIVIKSGKITEIRDNSLKTPMSSKDKNLYAQAWKSISKELTGADANNLKAADAVTGATISSGAINSAVKNALESRTQAQEISGELYAPEGISLYGRTYPVVTVENGKITGVKIIPALGVSDEDMEKLNAFVEKIIKSQSVTGLSWPDGIQDQAFHITNLIDQILYGKNILK